MAGSGLDRRRFLQGSFAAAVGLTGLGSLLAACGGGSGETAAPAEPAGTPPEPAAPPAEPPPPAAEPAQPDPPPPPAEPQPTAPPPPAPPPEEVGEVVLQFARPNNPVTHQLFDDNPPIESGLEPEQGPLRVYNWIEYVWKKKLNDFGKELGVEVELSTFSTMDEAIAKLASGQTDFDVFFPTPDRIGRLVAAKLIRPLNHDYLPNLTKTVWPALQDPFYDKGSQYTVPYAIYTTGVGFRRDKVTAEPGTLANPYDIYWDPAYKGKLFLLDDAREALGMVLLRQGITDLNTEDPALIDDAKKQLLELVDLVNVKVSVEDYTRIPEGSAWVHQAWSGDMFAAPAYLPEGTNADVIGYWYPPEGGGAVANDTLAVLRSGKSPVLAHMFLDYLLDEKHGYDNFTWTGYQPPFVTLDPDALVSDGLIPEHLSTTVVRESDFDRGYTLLELSSAGQKLWQNAWSEFKAGV